MDANKSEVGIAPPDEKKQAHTMPVRVSSKQLLGKQGELIIEHDGRDYRLRFTQNGKLILTA